MIGVVVVAIISAVILNFTRAKYRVTQSIPLVNGTINYTLPDLNIVGLYIDGVEATELDSNKTYILDTTQSTCTYKDGTEIDNLSISYDSSTGGLSISPYTTKGTKCTLYFNEQKGNTMLEILDDYNVGNRGSFNSVYTAATTKTIFQTVDWKGISYYFAGAPTDNWVKFGGFYWRIVRINGDGSTRLIYSGSEISGPVVTGENTLIGTDYFNNNFDRSEYVGLKYTQGQQHGQATNSTILNILNSWYNANELGNFSDYIDIEIGFCSDRNVASGETWASQFSDHDYAARTRFYNPSLQCNNSNDILKIPVGLITVDEIIFAGGVYGGNSRNEEFYLFNDDYYWTMTPYHFQFSSAYVFRITLTGAIDMLNVANSMGVRPVINLRAETKFTGSGTISDPYTVN